MARQRLGQHFLRDATAARKIVAAADISPGDAVLEIGPGDGALTRYIVDAARRVDAPVVLIELDGQLARRMADRYRDDADVDVICADARDVDVARLTALGYADRYKVVANLPYYAGTPIVRSLLERGFQPSQLTVMLQREVARDMCAAPGKMSLLSLAVQIFAEPRYRFTVPPSAFRPPPKVHSAVIDLHPRAVPVAAAEDLDPLFKLARAAFLGRRKQLHNSLSNGLQISTDDAKRLTAAAGIDSQRRPATLSIDEWLALTQAWRESAAVDHDGAVVASVGT